MHVHMLCGWISNVTARNGLPEFVHGHSSCAVQMDRFSSFPVTVMTMMTMYGSEGETVITVIIVIQLKFW